MSSTSHLCKMMDGSTLGRLFFQNFPFKCLARKKGLTANIAYRMLTRSQSNIKMLSNTLSL